MRLNFYLAPELVLTASFLYLVFEDNFQGNYVFTALLTSQIDVAEFAFAKWFADLEVVQTPFFGGLLSV